MFLLGNQLGNDNHSLSGASSSIQEFNDVTTHMKSESN